jgi:hypothetical protein
MLANLPDGVLAMFATACVTAAAVHWRVRRYFVAVAVTVLVAPIAFVVVCILQAGMPTSFQLSHLLLFAGMSLPFAIAIGLPFIIVRRLRAAHVA